MSLPFVFVIGFNKTATRTIHDFFERNGFPGVHWHGGRLALRMTQNCIQQKKVCDGYDNKYRVYSDMMFTSEKIWIEGNQYFRQMDQDYPGSYFIYNTRDMAAWIKSRANHGSAYKINLLQRARKIYGTSDDSEIFAIWRNQREAFEAELADYFGKRPDKKLLNLNINDDDAAAQVATFLDRDMDISQWGWVGKTAQ